MTGPLRARALVPRLLAIALATAAGAVAWRVGGGAEEPAPPPRSEPAHPAGRASAPVAAGDTYEVSVRLVEAAGGARFDMPRADAARAILKAHWRQQRPPHFPLGGDAARFVTSIALRASSSEVQFASSLGKGGKTWTPDARVWNMNEGSFDQREALVSPAPGTISVRVDVPRGARLTFAEGTVNATDAAIVFVVSVVDAKGVLHEVHRHALEPSAARRWTEASCDLGAFAGQNVELRLATETAPPTEAPRARAARRTSTTDAGAVREDVLARPGAPVGLWGEPTILAKTTPRVPYNVLWIVVDALRPDVIASFHDDAEDAKKLAAPSPPLEALLPKIPGLTPAIDDLAARGARFTRAYSAASWTRPGTLAMLSGARSSELGVGATSWLLRPGEAERFYASDPPLLALSLRRHGAVTRAFVNNYFMVGYAPIGLDMGFERVDDHRYRTRDTREITRATTRWIEDNRETRFFAFVNYVSPHEPYEPPEEHLRKIPPPPAGPKDAIARLYMAEAAKDDEAIGVLMRTLDRTGLRERTIVVLTADHGETMSSAHTGTSGLDKTPIRYHHTTSNYEETTKVPIVVVAPGAIAEGTKVDARVRTIDIAPTVLELLGLDPHAKMTGRSLLGLARGEAEAEERVVVSESRGSRAIMHGRWRLIAREGAARIIVRGNETREADFELYDLVADPGERRDLAEQRPEVVAEMRARLDAALSNVAVAGSSHAEPGRSVGPDAGAAPALRLRFAGGPEPRRVSGTITIGSANSSARSFDVQPIELGRDALRLDGSRVDVALRTSPLTPVGFDIVVDPPTVPVTWELWLDDKPWPEQGVFGGPFGLLAPVLRGGVATDEARLASASAFLPEIDAVRDVGLFVARERRDPDPEREANDESAAEMARLLREWGYAHGSSGAK